MTEAQKKSLKSNSSTGSNAPYIRTHSLSLGDHAEAIKGMDYEEWLQLIENLNIQMFQPDLVYAHKYEHDDIIAWDNRRTLHKSTSYNVATERRVMRRTTILGDRTV
jgi:taurine dioxygenase